VKEGDEAPGHADRHPRGDEGPPATPSFSIKDLKAAGADRQDAEVVADGNLVTSRQPDDLPAFCRAIVAALSKA
jgi:protease I